MDITTFIKELANNSGLPSYNEDAIKQTIVLPLFQLLGWNIFSINEVTPEYSLQSKRVDYALRSADKPLVFVEVKRPSISLEDSQEQLLKYCFHEGIRLAVLTNGVNWWFYLPLREGHWETRKYFSINIFDQGTNEATERFQEFLSKDNVLAGQSEKNAEQILKGKTRAKGVVCTLPKAWNVLISEPDELLIELLKDKVEDLSGYTPTPDELMNFFVEAPQIAQGPQSREEMQAVPRSITTNLREKRQRTYIASGAIGQEEMFNEILDVLQKLGGRETKRRIEELIFEKYRGEFVKEWYQEPVAQGVPRWKHNIAWAKEKLKHQGLIKRPSQSGRGIWELTESGKQEKIR